MKARRLAKEKNKELSVATLQFDVTFCTAIPCASSQPLNNISSSLGLTDFKNATLGEQRYYLSKKESKQFDCILKSMHL